MAPVAHGESLRTRTVRGAVLLAGQRVASLAITGLGGIALARLLGPDDFGVWAVLAFAVGLGVTFSDLGLGAALVQRRELDPAASLPAAFAANLGLALVLGGATAALAPAVARALDLGPDATP
ncbi:MAG: oligosaccharide flippase family protein, partial [Candidatus Rokuibacteriota bacterium]